MPLLTWTEEMSVGVPLLDSDHKVLMDIINSIEDTARSPKQHAHLEESLQTLIQYTIKHFGREEKIMRACGYAALHSHLDEHLRFSFEIQGIVPRIRGGNDSKAVQKLLVYLRDWWNHHILIEDKAYRPYAEGHPKVHAAALEFPPLRDARVGVD